MRNFKSFLYVPFLAVLITAGLSACNSSHKPTIFTQLKPGQSGIFFSNDISEEDERSSVHEFMYMGGGVGIGDFNKDGWMDIYLTGNQVSSRLYINQGMDRDGQIRFKDVTEQAGVATSRWVTGVNIADVNNDGLDDIYLCVYGGKNLLFINNGGEQIPTFTEQAQEYGLADTGDATQSIFFDYDKDGHPDLFLINYRLDGPNANALRPKDISGRAPGNDKLYRNMGIPAGKAHPYFTDVSVQAGIKGDGYGLGVTVSDFNNDSWPDIYVANDFLSNDELWLNNKNGTFTNVISQALRHQSYSSMGVDAADINNDQLMDIITLDMAPELNERKKLQYTFMNYDRYQAERSFGYEPSFMRNMLQLNNGVRTIHSTAVPFFSEIGQYAGISETDWSWSVLAADFNNDGWKDLHITNGSGRDFLNADFIEYSISAEAGMRSQSVEDRDLAKKLNNLGYIKLPDYLYLNKGDYTFENVQETAGFGDTKWGSISNGAAYVDIDNDGDLDLIVNKINEPASVFINNTIPNIQKNTGGSSPADVVRDHHYLQIKLTGGENNLDAFGTKVVLFTGNSIQAQEKYPVRGYLSSVDSRLFFGLGSIDHADSLAIIWPDNQVQILRNIPADTLLNIRKADTASSASVFFENEDFTYPEKPAPAPLFRDVTDEIQALYRHKDVSYNDFKFQPLLPQKYTQLGPFITTGDIDNDGLPDFFIGGGFNSSGALFQQTENGTFNHITFDTDIKYQEDMDCVFFDANGDGHLDLLITYGDTRYNEHSIYYKPRLYINDGMGNFRLDEEAIPDHVRTIAGTVAVGDYNGDGSPDLFIGGRVSKMYPLAPRSFLLHNKKGKFTDITEKTAPELTNPGMISAAVWADINNDQKPDLVIAGEWMPIRFFANNGTHLQEVTNQTGLEHMSGLWRSLTACDADKDGDIDFVAGNLGSNHKYQVTAQYPMKLFAADLDKNGIIDPVMFYYMKDKSGARNLYPAINRDELFRQVPALHRLFPSHDDYSTATFDAIFSHMPESEIMELSVVETRSLFLENRGDGRFIKHILPAETQFAPVNAIVCDDLDSDGHIDLLLAGNEYQTEVRTGRYDASYGYFLKGNSQNDFEVIPHARSGFILDGDIKDMALLRRGYAGRDGRRKKEGQKFILVAVNNDSMRVFLPLPAAAGRQETEESIQTE